jgi:hypothetical protein
MIPETTLVCTDEVPRPKVTAYTLYKTLKKELFTRNMLSNGLTPEELDRILLDYAFKGANVKQQS